MNATLGDLLRHARSVSRKGQREVAGAIGVDRNTVGRWERGTHHPPADKLILLARLYNVSVADLTPAPAAGEEPKG